MTSTRLTLCAIGAALATAGPLAAADLHVPLEFGTIQAAIDAALPGDTVIVADGVYTGDGNRDLTFGGKAITVRSANGPAGCTINCQGTTEIPHRAFVFTDAEPAEAVLDGFTITGGATLLGAIADQFNGGGILVNNGSAPTIRNMVLRNNQCGCWGGAICVNNGSPTISNTVIADNFADDDGGGFFHWNGGNPVLDNLLITNNEARVFGGGITGFGQGSITVRNSTIVGNQAGWGAGGVYAWETTVTNSIIRDNTGGEGNISGGLTTLIVTYSNVQGGFEGEGNTSMDPQFVDPDAGDYHLLPSSPLINAGDPNTTVDAGDVDMDDEPRSIGAGVDVGADEFRHVADLDFDGAVAVGDLLAMLAAWGPCGGDCLADTNGDGFVNVLDLLALLSGWGS